MTEEQQVAITVTANGTDLTFNVSDEAFNRFLNDQAGKDKVKTGFNFLSRAVHPDSREEFKKICLGPNNTPKGVLVMSIVGVLFEAVGGDIDVAVKKP